MALAGRPAGDTRESAMPARCFLCPFGDHPCDVASVEGKLLRVAERGRRGALPVVLLELAEGVEAAIVLPEHARPMIRLLAALPLDALSGLSLRVFHLLRVHDGDGDDDGSRRTLRTTPVSAAVLEPDTLLNITKLRTQYHLPSQLLRHT
jgi:hypothetical protein